MTIEKNIKNIAAPSVIDIASMVMLHDLSFQDKAVYKNDNVNKCINSRDGIVIYLKAVSRIESDFHQIESLVAKHNKLKNLDANAREEARQALNEVTPLYLKLNDILNEFIRAFSVAHDEVAVDFIKLFYHRFEFLSERLNFYYINHNKSYAADFKTMLLRVRNTFEKFLEIIDADDNVANKKVEDMTMESKA
jgi:hypothetical protein